jgi:hypothetical protein
MAGLHPGHFFFRLSRAHRACRLGACAYLARQSHNGCRLTAFNVAREGTV